MFHVALQIECVMCVRLFHMQPKYWNVWDQYNYTTKLNTMEVKETGLFSRTGASNRVLNMKERMDKLKLRSEEGRDKPTERFKAMNWKERIECLITNIENVRMMSAKFNNKLEDKREDNYREEYIVEMKVNTIMPNKKESVTFIKRDGFLDYGCSFCTWAFKMRVSFFFVHPEVKSPDMHKFSLH